MKAFEPKEPLNQPPGNSTKALFHRHDLVVGLGFGLTCAVAHLVWNPMSEYWQFITSTLMFTSFLTVWLVREWRRLRLFVTKFYCVVAAFDLLVEGLIQPVHHCTMDNLMCTGRMFLVFFGFWLLSHPVESWFFRPRPAMHGGLKG